VAKRDPARVFILDVFDAGEFAGREGEVYGWSVPCSSGVGPVIGARKGRDEDVAFSVYFEDTGEQAWFAPHLVKAVEPGVYLARLEGHPCTLAQPAAVERMSLSALDSRVVFTVEQRDALRERMLRLADEDDRAVAGAAVGSLALGGGDRHSDLDLTFAVADGVPVADVLDDWTRTLVDELDAVHLVDLERGPTTYRVFLLPNLLQFDLSLTPAAQFRPAGPRFRLLFGQTTGDAAVPAPPAAEDLFGWGVVYALHSRACIERGRVWQAEHYVGAVRDHALSLACLREGLPAVQARGYDDLSSESRSRFEDTHVASVEPDALRRALAASVRELMREGSEARLPHADTVAPRLAELH
jgi:hypothetical protein